MTSANRSKQKMMQERLEKEVRRLRRNAESSIRCYTEYLQEATQKLMKAEEEAATTVNAWGEAMHLLRAAGFKPETNDYDSSIRVSTTQKKLTKVYKAIGKLNPETIEKDIFSAEKKLIKVTIHSAKFPKVGITYVRRLLPTDPCKIETNEVPAHKEHHLVCRRS